MSSFARSRREHGTLLALDETHTHVVGPGGGTGRWSLEPDIVTIGKAVAGAIPMGAYGVTPALADRLDIAENVATGGTLFGNPLSAAAAKAALGEVLIPEAYAHTSALGDLLADGIDAAIAAAGLPWTTYRFGPRAGQWYGPRPANRRRRVRDDRRRGDGAAPDLDGEPGDLGGPARRRTHRAGPGHT